ncbi:uncharacterized protein LOC143030486 [Oratosquilla oratoria]|uniref:uncharacterized protein LOC143030486 n=1 Tax=Oratosquilla oratoria TaxID=337810 RepID=UPI003F76E2FA
MQWLCNNVKDSVNVYSVHTSMHGYVTSSGHIQPYCAQAYARVGRCLVKAILDYFLFLGIIPQDIPLPVGPHDLAITKDQLQPKPGRVQPCFLQVRAKAEARERAHRRLRAKAQSKVEHQGGQEDTDEEVEEDDEEEEEEMEEEGEVRRREKFPYRRRGYSVTSGESREEEEEEEEEGEKLGGKTRRRRRRLKRMTGRESEVTEEEHIEEQEELDEERKRWRIRGRSGGTSTSREGSFCESISRSSSSNADVLSPDGDNSDASGILVRITRHRHEEGEEEEEEEIERDPEGLRKHRPRHPTEFDQTSFRKNQKDAAALLLLPPQGLHGQGRGTSHLLLPPGGGAGVTSRHPKTTLMQLYPDESILSSPSPGVEEEDETLKSLPDLPSLTTSLPALSDSKKWSVGGQQNLSSASFFSSYRRKKRSSPSKSVAWKDMEQRLETESHFKYYDFRRISGPKKKKKRKRKRKRKIRKGSKSRSPSSRRRPKVPLSSSPPPPPPILSSSSPWSRPRARSRRRRPPAPSTFTTFPSKGSSAPFPLHQLLPSRSRSQTTRLVAGGGFCVSRTAAAATTSFRPPDGAQASFPPASSSSSSRIPSLRTIDVSKLTIGGFLREVGEQRPSTTSVRRWSRGGKVNCPSPPRMEDTSLISRHDQKVARPEGGGPPGGRHIERLSY